MSARRTDDELLLAAAVAGEVSEDDPRVQELLADHPQLREELQDLRAVASTLTASGNLSREVLAEAAGRKGAPGCERIESTLRAEIQRTQGGTRSAPPERARSRRSFQPWLVATAALVVVLWFAFRRDDARGGEPGPGGSELELGGLTIEDLTPAGRVDHLSEFRWRSSVPRDGFFEVQIDDGRRAFAGEERLLARIPGLIEPRWVPRAEQIDAWPAKIRWRVRALDASRAEIGRSPWLEVERSSD